ncbi:MAG: N-formylglutamate amidohydrolase [Pseudomonadota bacterium]
MSVVALEGPHSPEVPLVLDSPHSGSNYPPEFTPIVPRSHFRRAEDFCVDQLFGEAPILGLPLYRALFPRIMCDVNRARTDIDPATIEGTLPFTPNPSAKARLGKGVLWMDAPPPPEPTPLYEVPLSVAEVVRRLDTYWTPYRDGLANLLVSVRERHGRVFYVDCHSMQTVSSAMHEEGAGKPRPEIVLSDRDGATCQQAFMTLAADALAAAGFEVSRNDPYKGADLVRSHGRPANGIHALQIEVRRDLYMDEDELALTDGFHDTRARLGRALAAIRDGIAAIET